MRWHFGLASLVVGIPFALDVAMKWLAQHTLNVGEPVHVMPGFNLALVFNPGISFGLFPTQTSGGLAFMLMLQAMLCLGIALYAWAMRKRPTVWPLLLLFSGAIANLLDRFVNGVVTDYLDFYWGTSHWPAFNLADVWITLGVIGMGVIEYVFWSEESSRDARERSGQ
jgi:signal peptidase II